MLDNNHTLGFFGAHYVYTAPCLNVRQLSYAIRTDGPYLGRPELISKKQHFQRKSPGGGVSIGLTGDSDVESYRDR